MKPLIVLDIDNTLVFSQVQKFPWTDTCLPQIQVQPGIWCSPRPFLQPFLDWLFNNFEVGIWTAATAGYAHAVINNFVAIIGSGRRLKFVFTARETMQSRARYGGHKNLQFLRDTGFLAPHEIAVLVDDHEDAKRTNGVNCILVKPFGPVQYGMNVIDWNGYSAMCQDETLRRVAVNLQNRFLD